jgi:hypothetical protein
VLIVNCAKTSGQDGPIRKIVNKWYDTSVIDLICVARLMNLMIMVGEIMNYEPKVTSKR